jgi:hypothetical protein
MTRAQIIAITRESARLVERNEAGVVPRSEKHVRRIAELKRRRALQSGLSHPSAPYGVAEGQGNGN